MDDARDGQDEYTKPVITDHGDLQDLTAQGGTLLADVPIGAPVSASTP